MMVYDEEGRAQPYWTIETTGKDGRTLEPWEIPLDAYLRVKPPGLQQQAYWRRVHAMSVVRAMAEGKPTAYEGHTHEELEQARQDWLRVLK